MISPTEVVEEKILLSSLELDWEKNGNPLVNEGPEVILREHTVNPGDLELCEDAGGQYVAGMISTKDTAGVVVRTEETKDIYVTVFVKVDDLLDGVISSLEVRLNGEAKSQEIYAGENYQPLYFSFSLEKGENVLELRSDIGGSELKISRIEIREGN